MHVNSFMCIIYIYIYVAKSVCVCVFLAGQGSQIIHNLWFGNPKVPSHPKKTVLYNTVYASETSQEELAYCSICAGAAL